MSRIVYYIGAGASYGKRDRTKAIIEGLPVVAEIPAQFKKFRNYIAKADVPASGYVPFQRMYQRSAADIERSRTEMLSDIDEMLKGIEEHATIDSFARKLYLTGQIRSFQKLKSILCSFFVWAQLTYKPDGRYDTFLANVLEEKSLAIPSDISILSWNYDAQIETAYNAYNAKGRVPVLEKNIQGEWPALPNGGCLFKINGSASFVDLPIIDLIKSDEDNMAIPLQLVEFYHNSYVDTSDLGVDFKTHLSFAWEVSKNTENMQRSLDATTADTEIVVVIGYSFPFFNRTTDRRLFKDMPKLKKVYVQDVNTDAVIQSIQAVLPTDKKIEVVPVKECGQFYLPTEL